MKKIFNKYSTFSFVILIYIIWGRLIFPVLTSNNSLYVVLNTSIENYLLMKLNVFFALILSIIGLYILYKFLPFQKAIAVMYFYALFPAFLYSLKYVSSSETGWKLMPLIRASMFYPDTYHFVINIVFLVAIIFFSILNKSSFVNNKKQISAKEAFIVLLYFTFVWKFTTFFNI